MIFKIIFFYIFIDLLIVTFIYLFGEQIWLLNTQIAFFSSLLILLGSFVSYKKSITKRVKGFESSEFANRDEIDKIEDRFDLYSNDEELSDEEVLKDEKKKLSFFKSLKNLKYSGSFVSFYRLTGYIFLIVGFFFLLNNDFLHIFSYLFGFLIVPILSAMLGFVIKFDN